MSDSRIPFYTLNDLREYEQNHVPLSGFLYAVLSNNLEVACGKADDANRAALFDIVSYVFLHMRMDCRGSKEAVERWLGREPLKCSCCGRYFEKERVPS